MTAMSTQWKQTAISIKDKQTIISHLETSEKGANLALKFKNQQAPDLRYTQKQREDPEIQQRCQDKRSIENTGFEGFSSAPLPL